MKTYIILLRGVNVSGKNLIKMADLKQILIKEGFTGAATYIQSGNIILKSTLTAIQIEKIVSELIQLHFNYEIAVFCLNVSYLINALRLNPFTNDAAPNKVFITFLKQAPLPELIEKLQLVDFKGETFKITDKILYLCSDGMGASKMSNNF